MITLTKDWLATHPGRKDPPFPFANLKTPPQIASLASFRSQNKLADSSCHSLLYTDPFEVAAPWGRWDTDASYLHKVPVLKSLAGVSKESCVFLDIGGNQFQNQGTFRNETESNPVIQPDPRPALGPQQQSLRGRLQTQPNPPSCFSLERIQRKLQLGSLELTAWAFYFIVLFFKVFVELFNMQFVSFCRELLSEPVT